MRSTTYRAYTSPHTHREFESSVAQTLDLTWGTGSLELDQPYTFRMGTLHASVTRSTKDWSLEYRYDQDRYVRSSEQVASRLRTVLSATGSELLVSPTTADRSVVATPVDTIHIPAGAQVTLYMSSPLWAQFLIGNGSVCLADLSVMILSDTWFGPNTREGELCYSSATQARVFQDSLPLRPERIITPATFINEGEDGFSVDRLSLPLPLLSVYRGEHSYWTQEVIIRREASLSEAQVHFEPIPPPQIADAELVTPPREQRNGSSISRALSMLFS